MFHKSLYAVLVVGMLLAACGHPAVASSNGKLAQGGDSTPTPIVLTDGLGRTIRLSAIPQRIISLAPSNTEILFALGAGGQVIGRDQNSDYPAEAGKVVNIGDTTGSLNTELILSLKPDLVLAAGLNTPEQAKTLQDTGINVFMVPNPVDLSGMYDNMRQIARLTGHEAQAETLITSLQTRVKKVQDIVKNVPEKPLVYYELDGTDPTAPWTSGPGTFVSTLITMAGGRNVGNTLKDPWAQISLEELIKQDPDLILLGDFTLGGVTPEMVSQRAGWSGIAAVKSGKVFPFDDNLVSRPGPRLVDGLEALAKFLHPDLFK